MAATGQDFTLYVGNDAALEFALLDAAGDALDITGASFAWGMAPRFTGTATLDKNSGSPSEFDITDAAGGLLTVHIQATDTLEMDPGVYRHELRMTDSTGEIETVATGLVNLLTSILAQ